MAAHLLQSTLLEFDVDDVRHHRCSVLFAPPQLEWKRNLIYFPGDTQVSPTTMKHLSDEPSLRLAVGNTGEHRAWHYCFSLASAVVRRAVACVSKKYV